MNILERITLVPFAKDQYIDEEVNKSMIFLHHTASSENPYGVLNWWASTPERIATAFIVGGTPGKNTKWKDGDILQCFGSGKWAYHLGLTSAHLRAGGPKAKGGTELNKISIGIEICSWGQLTKTPAGFKSYAGVIVPDKQVCELDKPYKGFKYYHKYSDAQLETTFELVKFLGKKWNIPLSFKGMKMFDITPECLQGEPGVWTHTSCRPDKFDLFPQPELLTCLKAL